MQRLSVPNEILLPEVERLLAGGTGVTMRVKGNSMLPFIVGNRDSVVLVHTTTPRKGDIVLAHLANNRYVLHRIIDSDGEHLTLRGDGNLLGTEHCRAANIGGKVVKIIRNGKYIDTDSSAEKRKAMLWQIALPIRRYLLALYRRLNKQKQFR